MIGSAWLNTHCYACGKSHTPEVQAIYDRHPEHNVEFEQEMEAVPFVQEPDGCEMCGRA